MRGGEVIEKGEKIVGGWRVTGLEQSSRGGCGTVSNTSCMIG